MKLLLLDLGTGADADRLRSALAQENHVVDVVTEPSLAAWLADDEDLALVLVCARYGDGRVVEWCRRLRERDRWVPVGVILDEALPADIVAALDAGADDCVTRPVRFSEIAARVRALTRRVARARPLEVVVGDLRLDPAARLVWRGEDEIPLTTREFALLEVLMRNAGRVMTREALLESAWDRSLDPVSNVVDQYIGRLRRRLDVPSCRCDLETVRGIGYRLRPA